MEKMTKAFDIKVLTAKLKARGLPVAEKVAEGIFDDVCDWCIESATFHPSPIVKAAVPLAISTIKPIVYKELDKIDGQEG